MANWVDNRLVIRGSEDRLKEIDKLVKEKGLHVGLFGMPEEDGNPKLDGIQGYVRESEVLEGSEETEYDDYILYYFWHSRSVCMFDHVVKLTGLDAAHNPYDRLDINYAHIDPNYWIMGYFHKTVSEELEELKYATSCGENPESIKRLMGVNAWLDGMIDRYFLNREHIDQVIESYWSGLREYCEELMEQERQKEAPVLEVVK